MSDVETTGQGVRRRIHPGSGRRTAPLFPKGRQPDPEATQEVRALLGDRPRQRDFLIEYLHLVRTPRDA